MFPWPKNGGGGDWGGLVGALAWYAGILASVIRWFAGAVVDFIRDMPPVMRWVLFGVFAAMCAVVWDALTYRWLASLARY